MATGAQTWSTTAASNNTIDGSVNWSEGQAPSTVNDSARAMMASAAMNIGDNSGVILTGGTTAAFTITSKQVSTALVDGYTIAARFHGANTAAATLNVDGVAAKNIQLYAGTNVAGGEIVAGSIHRLTYHTSSTAWLLNDYLFAATSLPGDGSVSAPTYSFASDTDIGMYRIGANNIGISAGNAKVVDLSTSTVAITGAFTVSGAATLASSLTATNVLASGTLTASGGATFSSSAEVAGTAQLAVANISGAATLSSSLTVAKATLFSSGITVAGTAAITGVATLSSSLAVTNGGSFGAGLEATTLNLTSGNITFPAAQNASAGANTLDDYEEGTFTPALTFGGAAVGLTYTSRAGNYVKIGKLVHIDANIVVNSNGSSSGSAVMTGLPFTSNATTVASLVFSADISVPTAVYLDATLGTGATSIDLKFFTTTGEDPLTEGFITDGSILRVSGTYIASA